MTEYFCAKNLTSGFVQVLESFFNHGSCEGGTPYMGISPRRARPCTHWPARERAHQRASFDCTAALNSLGNNVFKDVFLVVRER